MKRFVFGWLTVNCLTLMSVDADASIEAEHPSDYVRVLESAEPELWGEAVRGLLGEEDELPFLSVSSVLRRIHALDYELQVRLARALRHSSRHPRTLETLLQLSHHPDERIREAAFESLLTLRSPGVMDVYFDLVLEGGPHRVEALRSLQKTFNEYAEDVRDPYFGGVIDPVMDPSRDTPEEVFDLRYLPAARALLTSPDTEVRREALGIVSSIFTPGINEELARLMADPDPEIQSDARWELAERGDPRPCPVLFEEAETVARTWTDAYSRDRRIRSVGSACAPTHFLDYLQWLLETEDETRRVMYREMIAGSADLDLLDYPNIVAELAAFTDAPDDFVRETVRRILSWEANARSEERADTIKSGVRPLALVALAALAAILGALLFIWAWRLYALAVRIRHRPISKAGSLAMGPVALEGEVQPKGKYLRHPVTGEPCVYYAGADKDDPDARFYLVDDTGRVLIDPRRAVLFSDDGVLVAGERVHLVGFADRGRRKGVSVVVGKDTMKPPAYRMLLHRVIEALFGFGRRSSVTKMLFSDPGRCFWIWDDLERRPMGEARDVVWLAASILLGGAWSMIFAIAVLGLIDQEMSSTLANALTAAGF